MLPKYRALLRKCRVLLREYVNIGLFCWNIRLCHINIRLVCTDMGLFGRIERLCSPVQILIRTFWKHIALWREYRACLLFQSMVLVCEYNWGSFDVAHDSPAFDRLRYIYYGNTRLFCSNSSKYRGKSVKYFDKPFHRLSEN